MKRKDLSALVLGAVVASSALLPTLRAGPLGPGDIAEHTWVGSISGTVVASDLSSFSSGAVTGKVGVTVLSGVALNPLGGLTFVYEVMNESTSGTEGVTLFGVNGWAGVGVDVAAGDGYFFSPNGSPAQQGPAMRSNDGDNVQFTFPPGDDAPPIFAGENSFQLILFTNASAWQYSVYAMEGWDFDQTGGIIDGTNWVDWDQTISAVASVPDGGITALLLGLGFIVLSFVVPRLKLAPVAVKRK